MIAAPLVCSASTVPVTARVTMQATRAGEYGRILVVPVRVNGSGPYFFFVDTGATTTTVGLRGARYIGLTAQSETSGAGATGKIALRIAQASLDIGGERLSNVRIAITPQFDDLHRIAPGVVGSLGLNALKNFTVALDFRTNTVSLSEERLPSDAGIPISVSRGVYSDATIDGTPVRVYLDSGAEVNMIGAGLAKRLQLRTFAGPPMTGVGGTGSQANDEALLRAIALGAIQRSDTVAAVSPQIADLSAAAGVPFDAIFGYPVFGDSCAIFDFPGKRALFL